jgi:hypothetical protein
MDGSQRIDQCVSQRPCLGILLTHRALFQVQGEIRQIRLDDVAPDERVENVERRRCKFLSISRVQHDVGMDRIRHGVAVVGSQGRQPLDRFT